MSSLVSERERVRTTDSTKLPKEAIAPDRHAVTTVPERPFVPSRAVRFKFFDGVRVRCGGISQVCGSFCASWTPNSNVFVTLCRHLPNRRHVLKIT